MLRAAVSLFLFALLLQLQKGPVNLDFRDSELGQLPKAWLAPVASQGFPAVATDQCTQAGRRCVVVRSEPVSTPGQFGNLMQYFDAAPYRNKTVRLRASVRVESRSGARAQLWLREDRPNQTLGFFDNMGDRPILSSEWKTYEINGQIGADAVGIAMGMMLIGGEGAAYIDNVSFEVSGTIEAAPVVEQARLLTRHSAENLVAYARLFGYIRHFHPSDEALRCDWEALAIRGVSAAEGAEDSAQLARRLQELFRPVAPTLRVFPASESALAADLGSGTQMVSWRHHGFGTSNLQSIYRSERVTAPVPAGGLPAPFEADLGAGVKALVPTTLYVDAQGTLPHAPPPVTQKVILYTAKDRAVRIADVILIWNVLQHFYPYHDVVSTNWSLALTPALVTAASDPGEDVFLRTLRRLIAALKDGHGGVYFGRQGEPAPVAWEWIEDRLIVTSVPDAQGQPIERGDAVVAINGRPVREALADAATMISGATPQWIQYRALQELGIGPHGEPLVLEIEPFGNPRSRKTVTLERRGDQTGLLESRPAKVAEIRPGILYVDLTRITDEEWKGALDRLAKASGIIFDLRGYPHCGPNWLTYLSRTPLTSPQWHVPAVTRPDHRAMVFDRQGEWNLQPQEPFLKARRVILTDGRAISYAESVMGIVENYKLARIIGGPTAGTNGNVNPVQLPGGYHVTWTGMKVLKHDGSQHHGIGIKPNIPVVRTRAAVAAGRDEVLERGIAELQ